MQNRSYVVSMLCVGEQTSSSILHRLHLPQQVLQHTIQQRVAAVHVKGSYPMLKLGAGTAVASSHAWRGHFAGSEHRSSRLSCLRGLLLPTSVNSGVSSVHWPRSSMPSLILEWITVTPSWPVHEGQ